MRKLHRDFFKPYGEKQTTAFSKKTSQGKKIHGIYKGDDDRLYVIAEDRPNSFVVGIGYDLDDGTWNQGKYEFDSVDDAYEWLEKRYGVKENWTDAKHEKRFVSYKQVPMFKRDGARKHKKDGGGAGYDIYASDYRSFDGSIKKVTDIGDGIVLLDCDIYCVADVSAVGYYTQSNTYETNVRITKIEVDLEDLLDSLKLNNISVLEQQPNKALELVKDYLTRIETKCLYGGGYIHVNWDGTIDTLDNPSGVSGRTNYYIYGIEAKCVDEDVIYDINADLKGYDEEESYTDSKHKRDNNYRGARNVEFVSHGEWSDPELIYKGKSFNYWDIEDALWDNFLEETGYTDNDYNDPDVEEEFNKYVQENIDDYLDDVIYSGYFDDSKHIRKPLHKKHDSITKEKTFIVKANSEADAIAKVKKYLKK